MNFEIVVNREAQVDLDEIFAWYEEQKQGLGFEFIERFEDVLSKISQNPFYAFNIEGAKSASLKRFPYNVIYRVDEQSQQIRIIAVIHQRRNPEWFKRRLQ